MRPSPLQGMLGTLAVCAKMLAAILSPKAAMQPAGQLENFRSSRKLKLLNITTALLRWTALFEKGGMMEAGDDSLGLAPDGGPMKVMPFAFKVAGSLGFSLACPQPGHTASTCKGGQGWRFSRCSCVTAQNSKHTFV